MIKKVYFFNDLRSFRERADLSQNALAVRCGCSRQSIIAIERGYFFPSTRLALLIVSVLSDLVNCDFEDIFWLQDHKDRYGSSVLYDPDFQNNHEQFLDEELDLLYN